MLQKYVLKFGHRNLINVFFVFDLGRFLDHTDHTIESEYPHSSICKRFGYSNLKRIWLFWFDKAKEMQKATLIDGQRKLKDFIKKTKSTVHVLESNTAVVSRYFQFPAHVCPFFLFNHFDPCSDDPAFSQIQSPRIWFSQLLIIQARQAGGASSWHPAEDSGVVCGWIMSSHHLA